jgi:hypothetical protein
MGGVLDAIGLLDIIGAHAHSVAIDVTRAKAMDEVLSDFIWFPIEVG